MLPFDNYAGQDLIDLGAEVPIRNIYRHTLDQLKSGERVVVATVIRSRGSTPQKPGSSALFGETGLIAGTVGGGLLEGDVQRIAGEVIISGLSDHYYFNLDTDQGDQGAICGGETVVLIDANPGNSMEAFELMIRSISDRKSGNLITLVCNRDESGKRIERYWIQTGADQYALSGLEPGVREALEQKLKQNDPPGFVEIELSESVSSKYEFVFVEHIDPLPSLLIAGAGHIGKALAHTGSLLDFEITVIDDRPEFANSVNIPEADRLVIGDIGATLGEMPLGGNSYVVIVTRGHQHDTEALKACITSPAAYIGMIGSSHKVGVIKKLFLEEGWATPEQWSRVHTPIGIPIGSKTVQEIAVSIAAQLIMVRNQQQKKDE